MTERTPQYLLDDDTIHTISITDPPVAEILSTDGDGWTRVRLAMGEVAGDTTLPRPRTLMGHRPPADSTTTATSEPSPRRRRSRRGRCPALTTTGQGGEPR